MPASAQRGANLSARRKVLSVKGTTATCRPCDGVAISRPTVSQSPLYRRDTWPECLVLMIPPLHSAEMTWLPTSATTSPSPDLGLTVISWLAAFRYVPP